MEVFPSVQFNFPMQCEEHRGMQSSMRYLGLLAEDMKGTVRVNANIGIFRDVAMNCRSEQILISCDWIHTI